MRYPQVSRTRSTLTGIAALLAAAGLCACSGSSAPSSSASNTTGTSTGDATSSSCGQIPLPAPATTGNVLADIPASYRSAYSAFDGPLGPSPWRDWKPSKKTGFTVAILWGALNTSSQIAFVDAAKADLKKYPQVTKVILETATNNDVTQQIQLFNSLVAQKPSIIILEPESSTAFVAPINAAAKQGIPTITPISTTPTLNAVSVEGNNYLAGADVTAGLVKIMHDSGNVLAMHSIPSTSLDADEFAGFNAVLSHCPNVKVVGSLTGQFSLSVAKSATLSFLATHPSTQIKGVFQAGGSMSAGMISAFQSAHLTVPPVTELGDTQADLGYWLANDSHYQTVGAELTQDSIAQASVSIAVRMLEGQGLLISAVVAPLPLVTNANIADWASPSWNLNSDGDAPGPASNTFLNDNYLNGLFAHGSTPK